MVYIYLYPPRPNQGRPSVSPSRHSFKVFSTKVPFKLIAVGLLHLYLLYGIPINIKHKMYIRKVGGEVTALMSMNNQVSAPFQQFPE